MNSRKPCDRVRAATWLRWLSVIGLLAVGLLSCTQASTSGGSTAANGSPSSPGETRVVGLGDSVPAAAGCACTSFVVLFGDDVGQHTGRPNHTDNYARNGLDTTGLLAQLKDPGVAEGVAHADLVTVTIGANDFATCGDDCGAIHYVSAVAFIAPRHRAQAVPARSLDLDHVGAEIGEVPRAVRPGDDRREVDHPHVGERRLPFSHAVTPRARRAP